MAYLNAELRNQVPLVPAMPLAGAPCARVDVLPDNDMEGEGDVLADIVPAGEIDDIPVFDRIKNAPSAYGSYLADGFEHDCAVGDWMVGGQDASVSRKVTGTIGKAIFVVGGSTLRAFGMVALARWAGGAIAGFGSWVKGRCISLAEFVVNTVANKWAKKAADDQSYVDVALDRFAQRIDGIANDPARPPEVQGAARNLQAYLGGELGQHAAARIDEAVNSDPFQASLGKAAKKARKVVVEKAVEDGRPYAYVGLAAGLAGTAVALYSGRAQEMAAGVIVGAASAAIGMACYYWTDSGPEEAAAAAEADYGLPLADDSDDDDDFYP